MLCITAGVPESKIRSRVTFRCLGSSMPTAPFHGGSAGRSAATREWRY
ncbi:MAG: hypothetical protein PWR21_430 [Methanoculleus sp.]|nr:hypothetical protein [Methanoculleus sp.]MDK2988785.1 hypothetical protein [Methanoculleus sp.]